MFERPTGNEAHTINDIMLVYFTSGTTGMPKMVRHNFAHPVSYTHLLSAHGLQADEREGQTRYFVSADTEDFDAIAARFLGHPLERPVEHVDLSLIHI